MVGREHRCKHTEACTCPGKTTKEEEYSDQLVSGCAKFVNGLGYKRMAMKSDIEISMRAPQQRVQRAVQCEMLLTNTKRYDSNSNEAVEHAI